MDFVAQKADVREYYQVTASMLEESTFHREITPLKNIKDFYPHVDVRGTKIKLDEGLIQEAAQLDKERVIQPQS